VGNLIVQTGALIISAITDRPILRLGWGWFATLDRCESG